MSVPLMAIGAATLEVIGLGPTHVTDEGEAHWPALDVFDDAPFVQSTGLGERKLTLTLAARPHWLGGMDQIALLKAQRDARAPVTVIRLAAGLAGLAPGGAVLGLYGIRKVSVGEEKIAPDGLGRRIEVEVEMIHLGEAAGGWE